jgi:hypothetical protein
MDERIEQLEEAFAKAHKDLKQYACEDAKAVHRYEIIYGTAYQKLVKAGLKPKLRLKYRPLY